MCTTEKENTKKKTEDFTMNAYEIRKHFFLQKYNTEINRRDFETFFRKTSEKVTFTFNGWDGKSYNGESRRATVYRTTVGGFGDVRLVKVGKGLHFIDEGSSVLEKATGESHPEAEWLVDVARA